MPRWATGCPTTSPRTPTSCARSGSPRSPGSRRRKPAPRSLASPRPPRGRWCGPTGSPATTPTRRSATGWTLSRVLRTSTSPTSPTTSTCSRRGRSPTSPRRSSETCSGSRHSRRYAWRTCTSRCITSRPSKAPPTGSSWSGNTSTNSVGRCSVPPPSPSSACPRATTAASCTRRCAAAWTSPRTTRTSTPSPSCAGATGTCTPWKASTAPQRPPARSRATTSTSPRQRWRTCTSGRPSPRSSALSSS
jgi:hypothetical protein